MFIKAFKIAEIANFTEAQKFAYEESMKYYRDLKNSIEKSFDDGKRDVAKNLKSLGVNVEIIVKSTGLSNEEIEKL